MVDICSGITPATGGGELLLRPNPAHGVVHLELPGRGHLAVPDTKGQTVLVVHNSSIEEELDIAGLPAGIYIVHYAGEGLAASATFAKE